MKGHSVLTFSSIVLLLTIVAISLSAEAEDVHNLYCFFEDDIYDVGSIIPVDIYVFKNGELADPQDVYINIDQFDETRRNLSVSRVGVGRYQGVIIVQLSDIGGSGTVRFAATAFFDPGYATDRRHFYTVFSTAFSVAIFYPDPNDQVVRPGQDVEFDMKISFKEQAVDPDEGSLTLWIWADLDTGEEWYHNLSYTRVDVGRYSSVIHIPENWTTSIEIEYMIDALYTVDNRTWGLKHYSGQNFPIQFYKVWTHHENVTRESADLDLYVTEIDGTPVSGATVYLVYGYSRDIGRSVSKDFEGTTDGDGMVSFEFSYPDISDGSEWISFAGYAEYDGFTQHFEGRFYIPPFVFTPRYNGLRRRIITEQPLPENENVTVEFLITMDGEPFSGYEMFIFAMTQEELLYHGYMVSGNDGIIDFMIRTSSTDVNVHIYRWNDRHERFTRSNTWLYVGEPESYPYWVYDDPGTTIEVEPFPPGGPIEVTVSNPDADGIAERCLVTWGVGSLPDYDYRNEDSNPDWMRRDGGDMLRTNYGQSSVLVAIWDGNCYSTTFMLPSYLPADVVIFVVGQIEFIDSPFQDIRGAYLEDLTATLPHRRPKVNITAPIDDEQLFGEVEVRGDAWAVTSLDRVELRLDGGEWQVVNGTDIWNYTFNSTYLGTGSHVIEARAFDGEIWSKTARVGFVLDMLPRIWIDHPTEASRNGGLLHVSGVAFDDHSLTMIEIRLDGGDWEPATGTWEWTLVMDTRLIEFGLHGLDARAYDGYQYSREVHRSFFVDQPPIVFIDGPSEGVIIDVVTLARGHSIDDGGLVSIETRIDNGQWTVLITGLDWSMDLDPWSLGSGAHRLDVRASDGFHLSLMESVNVTVDLCPLVTIIYPQDGSRLVLPVKISGISSDDNHVIATHVRIDNGEWMEVTGAEEWEILLAHLSLSSGIHTVDAQSFDSRSSSDIATLTFFLDLKPVVEISEPQVNDVLGTLVKFSGLASDDCYNVAIVQVRIDGGEWYTAEGTDNWLFKLELAEGEHTLEARCSDGLQDSDIVMVPFNVEVKDVSATLPLTFVFLLLTMLTILLILYVRWRTTQQGDD